jgi:hypothetical protein
MAASLFDIHRHWPVAIGTKIRPMTSSLADIAAGREKLFEWESCTHNPEVAGSNPAPATK